ncbi:MAG: GGDEF domain-containing protein [Sulfitobacter sp.]|nr:GGDEF domain-containing protein [Sulfitobacter sp.]
MGWLQSSTLTRMQRQLAPVFETPAALAFIPALCLAGFWFGGEGALIVIAALVPVVYLAGGGFQSRPGYQTYTGPGLCPREIFEERLEEVFQIAKHADKHSATLCIGIEDLDALIDRHGQAAVDTVMRQTGERILSILRTQDLVSQVGDARFTICTAPVRRLDLELCIQMAGRLQTAIEEPISIDGAAIYVSVSVGFCQLSRAPGVSGEDWLMAAATALREAQRRGPSAIRAYSDQMRVETETRSELREEVRKALDSGQIRPWFQPQISTDTGKITGFEALARWDHPERGMISPADFLPAVEEADLLERLAELMMYHALAALKAWDAGGVDVPQVGVNFAGSELGNPHLVDKIQWELDRFDLTPDRLAVEVLETVVASAPDDMVTRNINALGALGCRIDLDDFGTGHASISSIRRFSVTRIKIDRSFVTKADKDPEQRRMISAILTMAERLEVETLAEGVETVGEHAVLSQLGCDHVQGFGIARPMPFEQTLDWIGDHTAKLQNVPKIMNGRSG